MNPSIVPQERTSIGFRQRSRASSPLSSNPIGDGCETARIRVLVVDDDDRERRRMCRSLRRKFEVLEAGTGIESLTVARKMQPEVILLDAVMREVDGHTALTALMSDQITRRIPSIMMSELDDVASRVRALELGAVDFVTMPMEPAELHARIGAAAGRRVRPEPERPRRTTPSLARRPDVYSIGRQLTEREAQVVEGLLGGLKEREIAVDQGMSVGTVRSHKASIRRKLRIQPGQRSRDALEAILNSRHELHRAS